MSNQQPPRTAIIAGTGFGTAFETVASQPSQQITMQTPHGDAAVQVMTFADDTTVALLVRHGQSHSVPPHRINHAANLWALREIGVESILATAAVGSLQETLIPGELVVLDDFIDLRGGLPTTYFDGADGTVQHTDFSEPFSSRLRNRLLERMSCLCEDGVEMPNLYPQGTYLCVPGPRYETPAEVRLFRAWGADVVGMTVAPEAILARELGLSYAALAVVTNLGTGLGGALSHQDVTDQMARARPSVIQLFLSVIQDLNSPGVPV